MDCRTQLASLALGELEKGDFLMATKILTTGIRLEPNNHELYFDRSICHHKLGDYKASLDDANTAIRLNATDFNIYYQKGLALIGMSMLPEAITSFKKAIELRARQEDSKLSDIFKLLRDASNELNTARRRLGLLNNQALGETVPTIPTNQSSSIHMAAGQGTSSEPVDSTTDRPLIQKAGTSTNNQTPIITSIDAHVKNGNKNLVATNRNINHQPISSNKNQIIDRGLGLGAGTSRVSSSAIHMNNQQLSTMNTSPDISSINANDVQTTLRTDFMSTAMQQHEDQSKSSQFEWNIRRSERIFLHHTNEPGPPENSGLQYGLNTLTHQQQKTKSGSYASSINSNKGSIKRPPTNDSREHSVYQSKVAKLKDGASSHAESEDIDVDDSLQQQKVIRNSSIMPPTNDAISNQKRVMIAPSSSMPATSQQGPQVATAKDDSYSSKYKRLRRDRERARRGTSKLCTIKPSDLEDLKSRSNQDLTKRLMRVIAPIDGWLYSGQLCIDETGTNNGEPQYVVKLDGDSSGSSYLFSQDTVLNDVIKEVRVKSVSELRKGARICCYWSRQYKCLSTGVVTSRTFEATKSLVSVKYDNGDLSALPLEDLRLLPPDYPKYMSNCDPLLLSRNGDGIHISASIPRQVNQNSNKVMVEDKVTKMTPPESEDKSALETRESDRGISIEEQLPVNMECSKIGEPVPRSESFIEEENGMQGVQAERVEYEDDEDGLEEGDDDLDDDDDDGTIPPTDETIDFITSETTIKPQSAGQHESKDCVERAQLTKDNNTITSAIQMNNSRASSEENNYGMEYCPWMFDGPPKRSKRHGRTYRDNYSSIRRGNEIIRIGDSAELMPRDESILPFIAKIDGFWATCRGEMRVRVRWYYRLVETEGEPFELHDGENALFETDHFDENDVQSIYRTTRILSWTDYEKNNLGHVNKNGDNAPKIFYLAGYYDPVRRIKHLRSDVKEAQ